MLKPQTSNRFFTLLSAVLLISLFICTNILLWADVDRQSFQIKKVYGVTIHYTYTHESFFPHDPSARGSQSWLTNLRSTLPLVEKFLSKYPQEVIHRNLTDIFLLGTLEFSGKRYGGTYIDSAIYISTGGFFTYSGSSLIGVMHAEFSSILLHNYKFPSEEWEAVNKPTWRYLGSGFEMLGRDEVYNQTDELFDNGFLEGYSQASLEEDFNIFAAWVFTKPHRLRELTSKHERLRKKYYLVMKFYKSIHPEIDIPSPDVENTRIRAPYTPVVTSTFSKKTDLASVSIGLTSRKLWGIEDWPCAAEAVKLTS